MIRSTHYLLFQFEWFGRTLFYGMEQVGEAFVAVLGLDDSRYQDVLDGMSEEEMTIAVAINKEREEEYAEHERKLKLKEDGDIEGGEVIQDKAEEVVAPAAVVITATSPPTTKPVNDVTSAYVYVDSHVDADTSSVTMVDVGV